MRWDAAGYGAHTDKATAGAATEWFFAEGAQGLFFTYLLLVNPHASANVAHVTYLREGAPPVTRDYPLPPVVAPDDLRRRRPRTREHVVRRARHASISLASPSARCTSARVRCSTAATGRLA